MRSAEELMALREQGMVLTPQEEQKVSDYLAERRGVAAPAMADVGDTVTEMLVRTIPGAPAHLLADAAEKFRRVIDNERRRARHDTITELVRLGVREAADKLRGTEA